MCHNRNVNFYGREARTCGVRLRGIAVHAGGVGIQGLPERRREAFACTVPQEQQDGSEKQTAGTGNGNKYRDVKAKDRLIFSVQIIVIKNDPDGWSETNGTGKQEQEAGHEMAACTVYQALGQFDVWHARYKGGVTHANHAEEQS